MKLPDGVSISVPDLSKFGPQQMKDPIAITVNPGDRVMVVLPRSASQQDVAQLSQALKQWAPDAEFLVMSGPESITVIPGAPVEDKAPQGQDDKPVDCTCKGRYHHAGSDGLCHGEDLCWCSNPPHQRYSHGCLSD